MAGEDEAGARPWRSLSGVEGRSARLAEVRRLSGEGLDAAEIAERMGLAEWVARRDREAIDADAPEA